MNKTDEIYSGNFHGLLNHFESKQKPFLNPLEGLPFDMKDLRQLVHQPVPPCADDAFEAYEVGDIRRKMAHLQPHFIGQSQAQFIHATNIAILRRHSPPDEAIAFFHRLWSEIGKDLSEQMEMRWLISAATTFGDHGLTHVQRACGMGLSVMFDMMKLHDTERSCSGEPNDRPFKRVPHKLRPAILFDLIPYSMRRGDLDRNMLARLWGFSEQDDTIAPLAQTMLRGIMYEPRTIFSRVQQRKRKRKPNEFEQLLDMYDEVSDAETEPGSSNG